MQPLEKKSPCEVNPYLIDKVEAQQLNYLEVEVCYATEWDEFWSYVGSKKQPRWTWYLTEKNTGVILAWQNGRRQDRVLHKLLDKVAHLPIWLCYTDDWAAYHRLFPKEYLHIVGKDETWRIERKNLNFRTHIKRLNGAATVAKQSAFLRIKLFTIMSSACTLKNTITNRAPTQRQ